MHKSSIHICIEERYDYSLSQIKMYTILEKMFSTKYQAKATGTAKKVL